MADEKDGPYKVIAHIRRESQRGGVVDSYSIAMTQKTGYLKEVVPDAGDGQTARHICNLLNREHKMLADNRAAFASELGETDGTEEPRASDGAGLESTDI